ncbi:MAG: phosphatase PAP2 family protein [Paludibacteraceae bacterium]|nr:phosphatase PAP2 family protein [Paludibacteraceae bacterium]
MRPTKLSLTIAVLLCALSASAQSIDSTAAPAFLTLDSSSASSTTTPKKVTPYKFLDDMTFVGLPIFAAGVIAKNEKRAFRVNQTGNKHTLLTSFNTHIDDYSQFFGPAMATGLKIAGVEGRSSWPRYIASAGLSYAFMVGFVNSIKYTAKEMRPDGSTANSWPSGHTATAFVGATILHKEYGSRSPWFSVAGYGVATATGVMRVLNNRHWISDVLSGAGIGITSGELGYAIADLLFKDRGLVRGKSDLNRMTLDKPSFFAISMGAGFGAQRLDFDLNRFVLYDTDEGDACLNLKLGTSTAVSAEGAYFFNKYFGVGGRLRVNVAPVNGWDGAVNIASREISSLFDFTGVFDPDEQEIFDRGVEAQGMPGMPGYSPAIIDKLEFQIKSDHLSEFAADLGLYFSLPITDHLAIGTKLLAGRSIMQEIDLDATISGGKRQLEFNEDYSKLIAVNPTGENYAFDWDYLTVGGNRSWTFGTGISLTYAYKENYAFRLFCDYDFTRKTYTMEYNPGVFAFEAFNIDSSLFGPDPFLERDVIKKYRHTFILGGSFAVLF